MSAETQRPPMISLREAIPVWWRIALLSFGGPAGQIALMHRVLVEERRWLGERRFLHALNYCMILPGPEAQQLAIYIGWLMHGVRGGLIAGVLFVVPGAAAIMALSIAYALYGHVALADGLLLGLKAAVVAIVAQALVRVARRSLHNAAQLAIAVAAFLALFVFALPFPLVIALAGAIGLVGGRLAPAWFVAGAHAASSGRAVADAETMLGDESAGGRRAPLTATLPVAAPLAGLWAAPVLLLGFGLGWGNVYSRIAVFFSQQAVVTFGGAYAVLAYVAQEAVQHFRWLAPGEMLDGLGLAETTPGPLIMVTQFVGFLAAYRQGAGLPPLAAGVLGGLLTTWVTFVPCFLWIFLGAPFVETLRNARLLNTALAGITAAVVGVIANLGLWFALHLFFARQRTLGLSGFSLQVPDPASLHLVPLLLSLAAAVALIRFQQGVIRVIVGCAAAGLILGLAGLR